MQPESPLKVSRWVIILALLFTGAVLLPVLAYIAGSRLVGDYAGPRGLASYLGSIYADAGGGHPLAITLLLAPSLVMAIWLLRSWLAGRLWRRPE